VGEVSIANEIVLNLVMQAMRWKVVSEESSRKVKVEFFGPFRTFSKGMEIELERQLNFDEFVSLLVNILGEEFRERAEKENTTFILNRKIVDRDNESEVVISPGDSVAFALLIGGG